MRLIVQRQSRAPDILCALGFHACGSRALYSTALTLRLVLGLMGYLSGLLCNGVGLELVFVFVYK